MLEAGGWLAIALASAVLLLNNLKLTWERNDILPSAKNASPPEMSHHEGLPSANEVHKHSQAIQFPAWVHEAIDFRDFAGQQRLEKFKEIITHSDQLI